MSRFVIFITAAILAFGAGWFFANEIAPPKYEDVSMAMWIIIAAFSLALGGMASAGR